MVRGTPLPVIILTMLSCARAMAGPVTWHVDSNGPGDPAPHNSLVSDPLEDGSPLHPFDAIQEAIDAANDLDIVELAPESYDGPGNSTITFKSKQITVRGAVPTLVGPSVIYGFDQSCVVVIENIENATLENVMIIGGYRAICCVNSGPTVRNVRMADQQYVGVESIISNVNLADVVIHQAAFGGARFVGGTASLSSCTVEENYGPGLHCLQGADCQIIDSTITRNGALVGGGVLIEGAHANIEKTEISYNGAMEGGGVAAYYSILNVNRCQFHNNGSHRRGGGLLFYDSVIAISNSRFFYNRSDEIAGVIAAENSILEMSNSLLRNNDAAEVGALLVSAGETQVRNCTFAFNFPNALRAAGDAWATVSSSILWHHEFKAPMIEGEVVVSHSNVLGAYPGTGNIALDPKFPPLQEDLPLQATSPCINRGHPLLNPQPGETDLLGGERVQHCRVDMGAYESDVMDDCNANKIADACEILDGTQTDCNHNSLLDTCDLKSPPAVFSDDFPTYEEIDPAKWPQHNLDETYPDARGIEIGFEQYLESRSFDLSWAQSGRLSFDIFGRESYRLDIDYWTGKQWRLLRTEIGGEIPVDARRVLDIPRDGLHQFSRIRFRNAAMSHNYDSWYVDDVLVERVEADCDGDGLIEACAGAGWPLVDCNNNFYTDACDFGFAALGARADFAVGQAPSDVAAADFDQDGDLDLLVSTRTWTVFDDAFAARLLLNDGWGGFTVMDYEISLGEPRRIIAADLDGDGDMDAASATHILLNRGGIWSGFAAAVELPSPPFKDYDRTPQGVDVGDVDGDGDLDLLTATGGISEEGQLLFFLNDGQANCTFHSLAETGQGSRSVALVDVDSDGDLDAAATIQIEFPGEGVLLINQGQDEQGVWMGFATPYPFRSSTTPLSSSSSQVQAFNVISADLNRDGRQDLVVAHAYHDAESTSTVGVLLNRGVGDDLQWAGFDYPQEFPVGLAPFMLEAADMNADGFLDVIAAVANSGAVSILINRGLDAKGDWLGLDEPQLFASGSRPTGLAVGDFNEDGVLDVAVANRATNDFFTPVGTPTASVFLQLRSPDTDCDANGMPDGCDLDDGLLTDCDGDGKADPCEPDCNANGVVDHCDLADGTSPDCNGNAIPDECDIGAAGSVPGGPLSDDCNGDGIPDECQAWHEYAAQSPFLFYIVDDLEQRFTLPAPPPADSDVRIDLTLEAALNTTNYYADIWINDVALDRVFGDVDLGGFCPSAGSGGSPWTLSYTLGASAFNELLAAGEVTLRVTSTTREDCYWNRGLYSSSYARFKVSYLIADPEDCNASRTPDDCDIGQGRSIDLGSSGVPDECEGFGDADASDDVTLADWTVMHQCLHGPGGEKLLPKSCVAIDFDTDGDTDLRDVGGFQMVFGFAKPD